MSIKIILGVSLMIDTYPLPDMSSIMNILKIHFFGSIQYCVLNTFKTYIIPKKNMLYNILVLDYECMFFCKKCDFFSRKSLFQLLKMLQFLHLLSEDEVFIADAWYFYIFNSFSVNLKKKKTDNKSIYT